MNVTVKLPVVARGPAQVSVATDATVVKDTIVAGVTKTMAAAVTAIAGAATVTETDGKIVTIAQAEEAKTKRIAVAAVVTVMTGHRAATAADLVTA